MLVDIDIIMRVFMKILHKFSWACKPYESSLLSSLSLLVKSYEEEIQTSRGHMDTTKG